MNIAIRPLTDDDSAASTALGQIAFGMPTGPAQPPRPAVVPGRTAIGAFDGDVLAARVVDRHFASWFGGVSLPTAGIASVAVAPEYRGSGLLKPVFEQIFAGARERGAVVSGLYPTATGIYRGLGYEVVASFDTARLRTEALAGVRPPSSPVTTRRATAADQGAVAALYAGWARRHNAALDRDVDAFAQTPAEFLAEYDGISVAERDGEVVGYACWDRGQGYDESATLDVTDVIATDVDGYRALLRLLGSFATTTPNLVIESTGDDLVRLLLRTADWTITKRQPYMIKILDVCGALSARSFPALVSTTLDFRVAGDLITANNGGHRLTIEGGHASCAPVEQAAGPIFTPQGLAALYAGAQSCADLRTVGLVSGRDDHDDAWSLLFAGPRPQIRDYY